MVGSGAMRARIWVACAVLEGCVLVGCVLVGCGQSIPTFPHYGPDAGLECGDEESGLGECSGTEVCLQGHCYPRCSATSPCGPLEECSTSGVCVPRVSDAGMPDAPPPDACTMAMCMAPTPYCRAGACLTCDRNGAAPPQCGGGTPICDVGRGGCVAFDAAPCAPCASDFDCMGAGLPTMTCAARTEFAEQVCLPTCTMPTDCPQGFTCDMAASVCVPAFGTCTGFRAGVASRECPGGDADCAPVGATAMTGLFVGACFSDDGIAPATCHQPCGAGGDAECPSGQTCMAGTFCN